MPASSQRILEWQSASSLPRLKLQTWNFPVFVPPCCNTRARLILTNSARFWSFSGSRSLGETKIRLRIEEASESLASGRFSVLEIITEDRPFLLSSVLSELGEYDLTVTWISHPIFYVERDAKGQLVRLAAARPGGSGPGGESLRESFMQIAFSRAVEVSDGEIIEHKIRKVLDAVSTVVRDWPAMQGKLQETIAELHEVSAKLDAETRDEIPETIEFLRWLGEDHFIFMGVRDYDRVEVGGELDLSSDQLTGLGVMRDPAMRVLRRHGVLVSITPAVAAFLNDPHPIIVTKANVRSQVHRRVYMDYIGVKRFGADGHVAGERRFLGLFTSGTYNGLPKDIPLLRRKIRLAAERANFASGTHNYASLQNLLETFPRDELFQVSLEELAEISTGIMRLYERPRTRLFVRFDPFDRFVSILTFIPRERYSSETREKVGNILKTAFDGRVSASYPVLGDGPLVRVHYIIGRNLSARPDVDINELERSVVAAVRSWRDALGEALEHAHDEIRARSLLRRYRESFTAAYREAFAPTAAGAEMARLQSLGAGAVGLFG